MKYYIIILPDLLARLSSVAELRGGKVEKWAGVDPGLSLALGRIS